MAETRTAAAKKTTAKKAPAKTSATAKQAPEKKPAAQKAPAKKTTAKKAPAKKTTAKKAPAKKTTAKKAPAKKAPAKKAPARNAAARKPAVRATSATTAVARKAPAKAVGRGGSGHAPAAAFFDLDRTLIRGSANFPLALAAFKAGLVPKRQLMRDIVNAVVFVVAGASDERSAALRERILDAVAGAPVVDVVALGDAFIPHLADTVMPESQVELDRQLAEGRDRIIVSASPIEIVERLAFELGLEGAVGTRSAIEDGKYTGKLAGPFCYGDGKVLAVQQLAKERGYDLSKSVAYSDSISDLPFMEAVGHAVAINADSALRNIAEERGWRVVETRGDTVRVAEAALAVRNSTEELASALASLALSRGATVQSKITDRTALANQRAEATIAAAQLQLATGRALLNPVLERIPGF